MIADSPDDTTPASPAALAAHADWSIDPRKRWVAVARRAAAGWVLASAASGRRRADFLARLRAEAGWRAGGARRRSAARACRAPTRRSGAEADFLQFLQAARNWPDFFRVCATLEELAPDRPFYPARGIAGMTRASHAAALGLGAATGLSRACDRATAERPAGAPLFWTLGANQSGKAAIAAWRDMLLPALAAGEAVRLWPFAGPFRVAAGARRGGAGRDLSGRGAAPSRHPPEGQQAPPGRPCRGVACRCWPRCSGWTSPPSAALRPPCVDGFGADAAGEDRFDCVLGVLCVLNVLAGNRPDTAPDDPWIRRLGGLGAGPDGIAC